MVKGWSAKPERRGRDFALAQRRCAEGATVFVQLGVGENQQQPFAYRPRNLAFRTVQFRCFQILELLGSTPGRVYSRAQILEHISGIDADGSERTVDVHVRNIRAKIEAQPSNPVILATVFGVGYRIQELDN